MTLVGFTTSSSLSRSPNRSLRPARTSGFEVSGATAGMERRPYTSQPTRTPTATTAMVAHPTAVGIRLTSCGWAPVTGSSQP